jgi:hypothetical protein
MGDSTVGLASKNEPSGIGGWLILVAIGQIVGPLFLLTKLAFLMGGSGSSNAWKLFPVTMWGELAMWGAFFLFALWCSRNFFNKRKAFPTLYIWEICLALALPIVDAMWIVQTSTVPVRAVIASQTAIVIWTIPGAVIWTWYTLKSKRVKNTFVT